MTNPGGEVFSPHFGKYFRKATAFGKPAPTEKSLSGDCGSWIPAFAGMTVGAERFSPLTCILSLIRGEKLMNGEYGDWIPA